MDSQREKSEDDLRNDRTFITNRDKMYLENENAKRRAIIRAHYIGAAIQGILAKCGSDDYINLVHRAIAITDEIERQEKARNK